MTSLESENAALRKALATIARSRAGGSPTVLAMDVDLALHNLEEAGVVLEGVPCHRCHGRNFVSRGSRGNGDTLCHRCQPGDRTVEIVASLVLDSLRDRSTPDRERLAALGEGVALGLSSESDAADVRRFFARADAWEIFAEARAGSKASDEPAAVQVRVDRAVTTRARMSAR